MKSALKLHLHGILLLCAVTACARPIDRHALVTRHDVVLTNFDAANPLSVGNGGFALIILPWKISGVVSDEQGR